MPTRNPLISETWAKKSIGQTMNDDQIYVFVMRAFIRLISTMKRIPTVNANRGRLANSQHVDPQSYSGFND